MEPPPSQQQKTPATPPLLITKKSIPIKARVLFDYKKSADDELTLAVNDIVTVLDKHLEDEGWWKGELNGRIGVFPGKMFTLIFLFVFFFLSFIR
jgi:hypothetical protein